MKKIVLAIIIMLCVGCSNKRIINGKEQSFFEYVIINKNASDEENQMKDMWKTNPDMFPILRLLKWIEAKKR